MNRLYGVSIGNIKKKTYQKLIQYKKIFQIN